MFIKYYFSRWTRKTRKTRKTPLLFLRPKPIDVFQQEQWAARHHHPHPRAFYRALLIDCNFFFLFFFFNCHSTACSVVGRVSLTIRSIWNRCAALLKYAKSSPPLCCGYFEIGGELGYKSHPIILSTLDSRSKEAEMRPGSVEKSFFNRLFSFFARRGGDDRVQSCCSQSGTECALRQSRNC